MSHECVGVLAAIFFCFLFGLMGFTLGAATLQDEYRAELISRGLQEYDKQTGRLVWTEKAGGEKGGDK